MGYVSLHIYNPKKVQEKCNFGKVDTNAFFITLVGIWEIHVCGCSSITVFLIVLLKTNRHTHSLCSAYQHPSLFTEDGNTLCKLKYNKAKVTRTWNYIRSCCTAWTWLPPHEMSFGDARLKLQLPWTRLPQRHYGVRAQMTAVLILIIRLNVAEVRQHWWPLILSRSQTLFVMTYRASWFLVIMVCSLRGWDTFEMCPAHCAKLLPSTRGKLWSLVTFVVYSISVSYFNYLFVVTLHAKKVWTSLKLYGIYLIVSN
jgi:hypothetical protein